MSNRDRQTRPDYNHNGESIAAHLTTVFAHWPSITVLSTEITAA